MTLRLQLVMTDDLDEHENHVPRPATEVVVVSLDGIVRELHLTAAHYEEMRQVMGRYIDAGHEPGAGPVTVPEQLPARPGQGRRREVPGTRELLMKMRAFGADIGIEAPQVPGGHKSYTYPDDLQEKFILHLETRTREGDPAAAADLAMARRLGLPSYRPGGRGQS